MPAATSTTWLLIASLSALQLPVSVSIDGERAALPKSPVQIAVRAPSTDELCELLDKVREALGLSNAEQEMVIQGWTGSEEDKNSVTLQVDGRGRFVWRFKSGDMLGFDGDTAWTSSVGKPGAISYFIERERMLVRTWFLSGYWTHKDAPVKLEVRAKNARRILLDYQLNGGRIEGSISIDPKTYLPLEARWKMPREDQSKAILEWKQFEGVMFPTRIESGSSLRQTPSVLIVESVELAAPDGDSQYEPRIDPLRGARYDRTVSPELEVKEDTHNKFLVRPLINGKDVGWFIFDTGASGLVIYYQHVEEKAGLQVIGKGMGRGVGGDFEVTMLRGKTFQLGPIQIDEPIIASSRRQRTPEWGAVDVVGVIGYDVLARCVARCDFRAGTISLHPPDVKMEEDIHWEPLEIYRNKPWIRAEFEGHQGLFIVDTGAESAVNFSPSAVTRFDLLSGRKTRRAIAAGGGGAIEVRLGTIRDFIVAGKVISPVEATFQTAAVGSLNDSNTCGVIGIPTMDNFEVIFDYPHGRMGFISHERK